MKACNGHRGESARHSKHWLWTEFSAELHAPATLPATHWRLGEPQPARQWRPETCLPSSLQPISSVTGHERIGYDSLS